MSTSLNLQSDDLLVFESVFIIFAFVIANSHYRDQEIDAIDPLSLAPNTIKIDLSLNTICQ